MKYNKKRDNKKPLAVALGVLLALAPGAVILDNLEPVPVYADFGEFASAVDYATGITGSELATGIESGPAGFSWVIAALIGVQAYNDIVDGAVQQGFTASSLSDIVFCGYYNDDGDFRKLTSCGISGLKNLVFIYADDFNIYSSTTNSNGITYTSSYTLAYPNNIACTGYFDNLYAGYGGMARFAFASGTSSYPTLSRSDPISKYIVSQYGSPSPLAKQIAYITLPEPLSMSNGNYGEDYIGNVLKPYIQDHYPDMTYIFEPSYTPEYPSDYVPGMPKEWTVENPQLPTSPSIGLNAYKPDLSELNPSEGLSEFDTGFDFWWWITDQSLTHTKTRNIVLIAILCGLVGYLLWHLGGHL